jgi:hypothetical protein
MLGPNPTGQIPILFSTMAPTPPLAFRPDSLIIVWTQPIKMSFVSFLTYHSSDFHQLKSDKILESSSTENHL